MMLFWLPVTGLIAMSSGKVTLCDPRMLMKRQIAVRVSPLTAAVRAVAILASFDLFFRLRLQVKMPGITVKDVDQDKVVEGVALFLKKSGKLKVPEYVDLIKTAKFKELAPTDPDWFYVRCASILRRLYHHSPAGIGSICRIYGGRQRHGVRPSHFCRADGSATRKAVQALEAIKMIERHADGGRKLSSQGQRDLDRIAAQISSKKREAAKKEAAQVLKLQE